MRCQDVTKIAADPELRKELSFWGKIKFTLHRTFCIWCWRYIQQCKLLNKAINEYQLKYAEGQLSELKMSDQTKSEIKVNLKKLT